MTSIRLIAGVLLCTFVFAKASANKLCLCKGFGYEGKLPDTIYQLTDKVSIAMCGYIDKSTVPFTYSEFVLVDCVRNRQIDFWPAIVNCQLSTKKDTLIINEIVNLPTGVNQKNQPTIWSIEKLYSNGESILRQHKLNALLPLYSEKDISTVLQEYKNAKGEMNEGKMELANKLFIASLSGSKEAKDYFIAFETKFGVLDGAFLEEYSDLKVRMEFWEANR